MGISHPKIDSGKIKYLIQRDKARDLTHRWTSIKATAVSDLRSLADRTQRQLLNSQPRRRARAAEEDAQYDDFLAAAATTIPENLWAPLLEGMVQQHPTEGLAVVFPTPHNSVAVPIGNLTTAIQQFQREFNSARGRRSDDKRVTLEVLWNFLF